VPSAYDAVIAGAGIAGISTAFHLARAGVTKTLLCDPRPPLTLTSDKSTECYRNWWPGPGTDMVRFMNRSVELMEAHHEAASGAFNLSRRGYLFITGERDRLSRMTQSAREIGDLGAGEVRHHSREFDSYIPAPPAGIADAPEGADVFTDESAIRRHFSFLPSGVEGGVHVRRAGWLSAQQYGAWMLDEAVACGIEVRRESVMGVELERGRITAVRVGNDLVRTRNLINAAGPMLDRIAAMHDEQLPVANELHLKTAFLDHLGAVPRNAPMLIVNDPQTLDWETDERAVLREAGRSDLLGVMPASCHARPEGGSDSQWVIGLWEYGARTMEPQWPLPTDELYTEVVLRGLERAFPRLREYRDRLPRAVVDGGYYTKTPENRPLIGSLRTEGAFVVGALSGFGIMAAAAAGELAATHVTNADLPDYASAFSPTRYNDPDYVEMMTTAESGQL
jgi:glycine/D-amino acid oxidase-like deaminating enzyme